MRITVENMEAVEEDRHLNLDFLVENESDKRIVVNSRAAVLETPNGDRVRRDDEEEGDQSSYVLPPHTTRQLRLSYNVGYRAFPQGAKATVKFSEAVTHVRAPDFPLTAR